MSNKFFLCALLALLLTGCKTTSTLNWTPAVENQKSSLGEKVLWNLSAENRGMYLFYYIPIWSGYASRPNRYDYELFKNNISRGDLKRQLHTELASLGADKISDFRYYEDSNGIIGLGIIWLRSAKATGVAVKLSKK